MPSSSGVASSGAVARTRPPEPTPDRERGKAEADDTFWDFLRWSAGEKLSADEVRQLRPKLIEAIMGTGDSIDEVLSKTNAHHAQAQIWDLEEGDAAIITDTMLQLGRKSAIVAQAARQVAQGYMTIRTAVILLPRMIATAKWYPEHGGVGL